MTYDYLSYCSSILLNFHAKNIIEHKHPINFQKYFNITNRNLYI